MLFPNGSVITDHGGTLIVGETAGARYTAFTIAEGGELTDSESGPSGPRRPSSAALQEALAQLRFGPDGCALDAEGHIWSADEVVARCARSHRAARSSTKSDARGPRRLRCRLGDDGRTLLICAAPDFLEHAARLATRSC